MFNPFQDEQSDCQSLVQGTRDKLQVSDAVPAKRARLHEEEPGPSRRRSADSRPSGQTDSEPVKRAKVMGA